MTDPILLTKDELRSRIEKELVDDILPFWIGNTVDKTHGGFYGSLTPDLVVDNEVPRSAVLCGRILWSYAKAFQHYRRPEYLRMAQHAYGYLKEVFWDKQYGGVYWSVDRFGRPVFDRKHSYAQSFAIYGLSQYYQATGDVEALDLARQVFDLLEKHAFDPQNLGYIESCGSDWLGMADMRLSKKEPDCRKSMNTLLHLMEAYTNLLRVWEDAVLRRRLGELITVFLEHVIDPQSHHFRLFFDDQWHSLEEITSYGHDIEGSWLLMESAHVLGEAALLDRVLPAALAMAQAVYDEGIARDGSVIDEYRPNAASRLEKSWWSQAEGMVGLYNAFQVSGQVYFSDAAFKLWSVIDTQFIDHRFGDWYKSVDLQGKPILTVYKVGPWECPYHHIRACFEMMERLGA